jgi:hypothetical protein
LTTAPLAVAAADAITDDRKFRASLTATVRLTGCHERVTTAFENGGPKPVLSIRRFL